MKTHAWLNLLGALALLSSISACDDAGPSEAAAATPSAAAVETQTVYLAVDGMHCEPCTTAIADAVGKLEGVESVKVELEAAFATVELAPGKTSSQELVATINRLGYTATIIDGPREAPPSPSPDAAPS